MEDVGMTAEMTSGETPKTTPGRAENGKETPAQRRDRLAAEANALPLTPGVYIMKDGGGKVIYVGKSKALRNRVSQYFARHDASRTRKTQRMVSSVRHFDYILCDTEMEALALENKLIKLYSPRYNIRLKDGKSYPYIKLTVKERYPRFIVTRTRSDDSARYFGPFSGIETAYTLLKTAQRMFALPSCRRQFPKDIGKERPCLYHQLGQCCAPCTGEVSEEEYRDAVRGAGELLAGRYAEARKQLREKMEYASDNLQFEAAALFRDRLKALDALLQRQKAVGAPDSERDVAAVYRDDMCECAAVFYIRQGYISDTQNFVFTAGELEGPDGLSSFLCELYSDRAYIPKEILIDFELPAEEIEALEGYISSRAGHAVKFRHPQRGEAAQLCRLAAENAAEKAEHWKGEWERSSKTQARLASLLGLEALPDRIEVYDISNTGEDATVCGQIVWEDGKLRRGEYRTYGIKTVVSDDYGAMSEAIRRRIAHTEQTYPDLILLDGGRGHVSVIRALLAELAAAAAEEDPDRADAIAGIAVFGMVKDDHHKTRAIVGEEEEISIALETDVYRFVYALQEEVHRYAIGRMKASREKNVRRSSLEDIDGVGPAKAKLLLRTFGSLAGIAQADTAALTALPGITPALAEKIKAHFGQSEGGDDGDQN